jgi:hypothetical protein
MIRPIVWSFFLLASFAFTKKEKNRIVDFSKEVRVIAVMDDACPISNYYTPLIRQWYAMQDKTRLSLVGVLTNYSNKKEFKKKYSVDYPLYSDREVKAITNLEVHVVPEYFVFNQQQQIVYRGKWDDQIVSLGKFKPKADTLFVEDIVNRLLKGDSVYYSSTKAIGCQL